MAIFALSNWFIQAVLMLSAIFIVSECWMKESDNLTILVNKLILNKEIGTFFVTLCIKLKLINTFSFSGIANIPDVQKFNKLFSQGLVQLSANNFFQIDFSLAYNLLGALVTYTIILYQSKSDQCSCH